MRKEDLNSKKLKKSRISNKNPLVMRSDLTAEEQDGQNRKNPNHEILIVTYLFVGLFVLLLGYFVRFMVVDSTTIINNSYNKRQDLLAKRVDRGEILSADGQILAKTVTDKKGNSTREYPYDDLFAHVVGRFEKGRTGIESSENFNLLTSHDNPLYMLFNEIAGKKNIGDNVVTTLNVDLQKAAYNALGDHRGAVVVLEPSTGKILAMVSKPDYNPNHVIENWDSLSADSDNNSAFINRATQGLYPPGSTYKIVTALEYLREHLDALTSYSYDCKGKDIFESVSINCYDNEQHGKVDLVSSFAESCNTSFANIGMTLDIDKFKKLNEDLLFNKQLPTNIPYKISSFDLDKDSARSEIPQTAIGQGKTLISPFHNALITASIANGGVLMSPYLVDRIENYSGSLVKKRVPVTYDTLMTEKEAAVLTKMMTAVVEEGTATSLKDLTVSAAGKTGSAEFDSTHASHAWFVGFAPTDKPQLVVSVIVEGAGTGSAYAVPIAKKLFQVYFDK